MTRYTYNPRRQPLTVTDPRGGVTTNSYDINGNLLSSRDALSNTTTNVYNSRGLLTSTTDALGNVTRFEYDAAGRVFKETDALGHDTTFTYDANSNRLTQTTSRLASGATETLTTAFEYDRQNRLVKTIYPDGSTTQVVYNSIGQQSATIDQLGRQTTFEYDAMGRLTRTSHPDGTSESSTYDAEGRRLTSTDRAGRITSFSYDPLGRLLSTTFPDSATRSTAYDAIGRVTSTTDERNNTTTFEYDAANRRTKITDALNNVTQFAYDATGNQSSMTDARSNMTSFEYDPLNRRTRTIYADNTFDSQSYDSLGRVVSKTDQAGKTTQYGYDALGRLIRVTDVLNQLTTYSYDELGNQLTQTDALGRTTRYEYDKLGRRTKRTLPLGQVETYSHNAVGNLTNKRDFNGKTTTFSYDSLNRLLSRTPDPTFSSLGAIFAAPITFTYTLTGRRASMTDPSGTTTYAYDNRDRLITKATPQGTLSYSYDSAGNLASMKSSNTNGVSVSYSYDSLNRLSTVTDNAPVNPSPANPRPATGTTTYGYDPVGNLDNFLYPNGVKHQYSYNSLNRLTNVSAINSLTTTTLGSFTYELGPAGNRLSVTDLNGRKAAYSYDDLYRLTRETITGDSISNNGSISYVYDAVGNRLRRTSTVAPIPSTTHSYDVNDRSTIDTYDANGSTTASGANTYSYDFENRIIALNPGTPAAVTFLYDGDGNRVAKTVGGVTTRFLVDDLNPTGYAQVAEEVVGGNVPRVYTHGHSLISQAHLISNNWVSSFFGMDGHGSVHFLTDSSGTITDTYTFDAFGNMVASTGATPNNYLYAGEQFDLHLRFYYLRARYMNPQTGRFSTMDPVEGLDSDPLSLHKYTYAGLDPVNRLDPSGQVSLLEQEETAAVSAVLNSVLRATLAAERARRAALAIRIVVSLLVGTTTLLQRSDGRRPPDGADRKDGERHAGVLQAQGDDIQKEPTRLTEYPDLKYDYRNGEGTVSWSWNESVPLPAIEASRHLQQLAGVLSPKQLLRREQAFKEASRFIINAAAGGGVPGFFSESFPKNKARAGVDYVGGPRVDIVVYSGLAFVQ